MKSLGFGGDDKKKDGKDDKGKKGKKEKKGMLDGIGDALTGFARKMGQDYGVK